MDGLCYFDYKIGLLEIAMVKFANIKSTNS